MTLDMEQSKASKKRNRKVSKVFLKKVWGALPTILLVVLVIAIFGMLSNTKKKSAALEEERAQQLKKEEVAVNVVALKMSPTAIRDRITFPGTVQPWVSLDVLTEVGGKVKKLVAEEGNTVLKGEIIALIDPTDYRIAYNKAKASLDAAKSSLSRYESLYKDQLTTRANLDNAIAEKESAKAAFDSAELNLARCKIKAPISGMINQVHIDEGQFLSRSDKAAQILQMDRVKINVGIPESDVEAVRKLTDFKITIDALEGKEFLGKKHFLSRTADPRARLYNLSISLDNISNEILPDMFARVEIVKFEVEDALTIPLYAVISRNDKNIVYVVNDEKAHEREVTLGLQEGWRVQTLEGLLPGDQVIIVGQRSVNDEQGVSVVRVVDDPDELNQ